jgi:hypothetical protein
METAFYYVVRAKLIKKKINKELDFLEFETKFEDDNPIVAREKALNHYQSYIDVLLNQDDITDKEARLKLKSFLTSDKKSKIDIGGESIDISDSFGNGIGVFMIINIPIKKQSDYDLLENNSDLFTDKEFFIHGIGNISFQSDDPNYNINDLEQELEYYKHYGYSTNNKEVSVIFCDRDEWEEGYLGNGKWLDDSYKEPNERHIIKTPFDWTGFEEPYWWGKPDDFEKETNNQSLKTIEELIDLGENNQIEFKPALLYNFSSGKPGIGVKGIIAKTICAFLNSNGGFLFIGVSDSGQIQGLDYDFKLSKGKNPKDFFRLEFDQMLEHFLSFTVKSNVVGQFHTLQDKEIFVVSVSPMKRRPVFLNGQFSKEFYVRGEASTRQLTEIEDIVNYCIDRWTK